MTVRFMCRPRRIGTMQSAADIAVAIGKDVTAPLPGQEFILFAAKSPPRRRKGGNTNE